MADTFKTGDLVVLKSGGPKMTVVTPPTDQPQGTIVETTWFNGDKQEGGSFKVETLQPATERRK